MSKYTIIEYTNNQKKKGKKSIEVECEIIEIKENKFFRIEYTDRNDDKHIIKLTFDRADQLNQKIKKGSKTNFLSSNFIFPFRLYQMFLR